jgi:hypothetical protein
VRRNPGYSTVCEPPSLLWNRRRNKFFFILKMFVQNLHDKLCQFRLKWTFGWCLISFYGLDKHRGDLISWKFLLTLQHWRYLKPNYVENCALRDILAACSANWYNRRKLLWWCQNWYWKLLLTVYYVPNIINTSVVAVMWQTNISTGFWLQQPICMAIEFWVGVVSSDFLLA